MTKEQENIISRTQKANACAESAFWRMKNIDADDIDDLRSVGHLTMDIVITIKNDSK